jgi:hypothetical protein
VLVVAVLVAEGGIVEIILVALGGQAPLGVMGGLTLAAAGGVALKSTHTEAQNMPGGLVALAEVGREAPLVTGTMCQTVMERLEPQILVEVAAALVLMATVIIIGLEVTAALASSLFATPEAKREAAAR